jgi:hypothetical protein
VLREGPSAAERQGSAFKRKFDVGAGRTEFSTRRTLAVTSGTAALITAISGRGSGGTSDRPRIRSSFDVLRHLARAVPVLAEIGKASP